MTAQEAQTTLELQPPFTTVALKAAHKNALVKWLPAQFMSDRAQLNKALEQTARIHEAYDLLLPLCEAEEATTVNPWLEQAMRHAYGHAPSASATAPEVAAQSSVESQSSVTAEPPARRRPILAPSTVEQAPVLRQDTASEPEAAPPTPAANPFLHDIGPLKTPGKISAECPKVELRGKSGSHAEQTSSSAAPSSAGSAMPSRTDPAIKVRPPKVIIAPRVRGPDGQPSMPVATVPVPLPLPLSPVAKGGLAAPPALEAESVPEPSPEKAEVPASTPVAAPTEPAMPVATSGPLVAGEAGPDAAPAPRDEAIIGRPAADEVPAAEAAPLAVPEPSSEPAATSAAAAPAPHVSAAEAEEAAVAEQASHHVPSPPAAAAAPGAHALPPTVAKPIPARIANGKAKSETSAADAGSNAEEPAGDHALVPALGDRYHPAEKEGSPNTDTSRHFPARPVAPSGAGGTRGTGKEDLPEAETGNGSGNGSNTNTAETAAHSPAASVSLSAGQKVLRFFIGVLCIVGFGGGIYWLSQSGLARDPWGMEPGSGGPGERIKQRVFESIKGAAENGNADAQMKVARAYQHGKGVAQNPEEAVKWFQKAAEQGNVDAQYALGDAYKSGVGVPQDNAEALKWYRMAEATREEQRAREEGR